MPEINPKSSEWRAVEKWAQAEIRAAQDRLEASEDRAEFQRGRLSALRELIRLPEEGPAVMAAGPTYLD